jgi:hypothetical protein
MSNYLDRLISEKRQPDELPKLPKASYVSFDSAEGKHISENHAPTAPRQRQDTPAKLDTDGNKKTSNIADESSRRFDFCEMHRRMLGGICKHLDAMDRRTPGKQAAARVPKVGTSRYCNQTSALDACLLWRLIRVLPCFYGRFKNA